MGWLARVVDLLLLYLHFVGVLEVVTYFCLFVYLFVFAEEAVAGREESELPSTRQLGG